MPKLFDIEINEDEFNNSMDDLYADLEGQFDEILEENMDNIEANMKALSPVDMGQLRASIMSDNDFLEKQIRIDAFYAPYIEFGTGLKASAYVSGLPADWQEYAQKFMGKSENKNFDEFIDRMIEWTKRKGITGINGETQEQIAYMIARSIMQKGVTPHPFIYPSIIKGLNEIYNDLNKIDLE